MIKVAVLTATLLLAIGIAGAAFALTTSSHRQGQLPLLSRDSAIYRAAFSGVPRATCASSRFVVACGDHAGTGDRVDEEWHGGNVEPNSRG